MNLVIDATSADLDWDDLPEEQCPVGPVRTGVRELADTFTRLGVWEHPAGTSTDVEQDEVFVVLSGSGRVILGDGAVLLLRPGTVGILEAGTSTTWVVDEPLRKVWIAPK
jgi:uncharacterized cupin superfamily protein